MKEKQAALTRPDADHDAQALLPSPHDDGGQDLAAEQAVLDAGGEGVEALVAQHGDLVVQGASADGELQREEEAKGCSLELSKDA